jgi:hypothetical protein
MNIQCKNVYYEVEDPNDQEKRRYSFRGLEE